MWPEREAGPPFTFKISMLHVFCSSHGLAHFAALFIDPRAKWSTVQGHIFIYFCAYKHIFASQSVIRQSMPSNFGRLVYRASVLDCLCIFKQAKHTHTGLMRACAGKLTEEGRRTARQSHDPTLSHCLSTQTVEDVIRIRTWHPNSTIDVASLQRCPDEKEKKIMKKPCHRDSSKDFFSKERKASLLRGARRDFSGEVL